MILTKIKLQGAEAYTEMHKWLTEEQFDFLLNLAEDLNEEAMTYEQPILELVVLHSEAGTAGFREAVNKVEVGPKVPNPNAKPRT